MTLITNAERLNDFVEAVRLAIQGELKKVWTATPAIVQTASNGHTAAIQPAVNGVQVQPDGTVQNNALPQHLDAPVHFMGGAGATFTHGVQSGDEGIALILSRAQDSWFQNGGVGNNPIDDRMFDLSDARYIPGGRSAPNALNPPAATTSAQMRADNGDHVVDVNPANGVTHASTTKVMTNVGGASGSGTLHLPGKIIKNAAQLFFNSISAPGLPPPGPLTFANKMGIATTPLSAAADLTGGISSIMSGVLSGGIGSVLADPTAAVNSALSSATATGASAIAAALGSSASGLVAAMTGGGGLTPALATLATGTGALSGAVAPTGGAYGLIDVLAHAAAITQYFGSSPPPAVSLSTVLAPLHSGPTMAALQTQLSALVASVIAGGTTIAAATTTIAAMTAELNALMPAANTAISTLQAAKPALALAASAGTAGISLDPNQLAVAGALAGSGLATLTGAMAAVFTPSAADAEAAQSFPDGNAVSAGATGGF